MTEPFDFTAAAKEETDAKHERAAQALYGYARRIPDDVPTWEEADEETRKYVRGAADVVIAAFEAE